MNILRFLIVVTINVMSPHLFAADICEAWFLKSGIKSGTKDCELNCSIIKTDLGAFDCPGLCKELCKTTLRPDTMAEIAKYVEPMALTPSEKSLIAKYPIDALRVYQAKQAATNSTKRIFGGNFRNDETDAYRHFMWSGLMRDNIEKERAEAFLNAHEANTGEPDNESQMDKSNNQKGISAAEKLMTQKQFDQTNLEKEAIQSLKRGDLNILSPKGKAPEWTK